LQTLVFATVLAVLIGWLPMVGWAAILLIGPA